MPNRDHAPIRVLAVDDDPRFCELISDTLTGCSVATVHNETDALSRVQMFDFDVVLTDVNIGGIGGIAVCQRIARGTGGTLEHVDGPEGGTIARWHMGPTFASQHRRPRHDG